MPPANIRIREGRQVFSAVIGSPVGDLTLLAEDQGLRGLLFACTRLTNDGILSRAVNSSRHPVLRETARQIDEYFKGTRKEFLVPLSLEGSGFQLSVWRELATIPYGGRISYGELAVRLGDRRKARAVGGSVGMNPVGIIVPCHRVVGADGSLTGFGGGLDVKAALLEMEGGHCSWWNGFSARSDHLPVCLPAGPASG